MSEANCSRFRQQLYPPDSSKVRTTTQLPVIKVPADRLHNPVIHARPWFAQAAPVQSRGQPAQKPAFAQLPHQVASSHPDVHLSHKTALSSFIQAAQPAPRVPGGLLPASEVISHAPLPGSALLPSSPWRQNSPPLQAQAAPSTSGTSVIIAKDICQPTLAQALGFGDSPQQSPSIGSQAPAAPVLPHSTVPIHTTVDMRAIKILSPSTVAPSQAEQAGAEGISLQRAPHGIPAGLSQSDLQRLVTQAEAAFAGQPAKFDAFLHLLHEHQANRIDKRHFEQQVSADIVLA